MLGRAPARFGPCGPFLSSLLVRELAGLLGGAAGGGHLEDNRAGVHRADLRDAAGRHVVFVLLSSASAGNMLYYSAVKQRSPQ